MKERRPLLGLLAFVGSVLICILALAALGSACGESCVNCVIGAALLEEGKSGTRSAASLSPMATSKNVFIFNSDHNKQECLRAEVGSNNFWSYPSSRYASRDVPACGSWECYKAPLAYIGQNIAAIRLPIQESHRCSGDRIYSGGFSRVLDSKEHCHLVASCGFGDETQIGNIQPSSLFVARCCYASVQRGFTLPVASLCCDSGLLKRPVHCSGKPIHIADQRIGLVHCSLAATLHLVKSTLHNVQLMAIYTEYANSSDRQDDVNNERGFFKDSKFTLKLFGLVLLSCGFIFGLIGHFSLFYSGIRWRWRKRLVCGVCAWLVAYWLAVHGCDIYIQASRSANSHTRSVIPAFIAGVAPFRLPCFRQKL